MTDKIDKFHTHEALHTTNVMLETWDAQIYNHPFIQHHGDLCNMADDISAAMMKLYSEIGKKG